MDLRLEATVLHNSLHRCLASWGTGTGIIEANLVQQLGHLEQMPFFGIFIDLRKVFEAMDQGCCLEILMLHGANPQMLRLICNFWDTATNVCWAKGNYNRPFKAGCSVTQGGLLSAKLFNSFTAKSILAGENSYFLVDMYSITRSRTGAFAGPTCYPLW